LSLPEIKDTLTGYTFEWKPEHISIQVSRLKAHSDGRLTGEVIITTSADDYDPHLYQAQFNFSAGRSRKELAKILFEQSPNLLKLTRWAEILEQLCVHTIRRMRAGEPVKKLAIDDSDIPPPEYLLEPILLKGLPTIIFGDKGVHKTTLSILFAMCLLLPWNDNPLGLGAPDRSIKTLILDWEQEDNIVRYYAKQLRIGMNLPYFELDYRHCAQPLVSDLDQIRQHMDENETEVIIIDSLGAACGGELNKPEPALSFFSALRQLKTTPLILAQQSKDPDTKRKSPFGSTYFTYYSRSIFELIKAENTEPSQADIALFHRWANYSALHRPIGYHLNYNGAGISVESQAVDMGQFIARHNVQSAVYELLKRGALKPKEIANQLRESDNSVRVALSRLMKAGKLVHTEEGYGRLSKDVLDD